MLRMSLTQRTAKEVLREMSKDYEVIKNIKERKLQDLEHIMRQRYEMLYLRNLGN